MTRDYAMQLLIEVRNMTNNKHHLNNLETAQVHDKIDMIVDAIVGCEIDLIDTNI